MKKLKKQTFNSVVNLFAVVLGMSVVAIALTNHFRKSPGSGADATKNISANVPGTKAAPIPGFDYRGSAYTLLLFLDADAEDSYENLPLFSELTAAQTANPGLFRIVALFSGEEQVGEAALKLWARSVEHRFKVDKREYNVSNTPAVLLVNRDTVIEKDWSGEISSAQGVDIKRALGLPVHHTTTRQPAIISKELPVYDESKPLRTVELPAFLENHSGSISTKYRDPQYKEINVFDVDKSGNLYFTYQEHIVKVDSSGKIVKSARMPRGFQFGYCVDSQGDSYLYLSSKEIAVWTSGLEPKYVIKLHDSLGSGKSIVAKMDVDERNHQLYLQTYDGQLKEEKLYRIDLLSHETKTVYQLTNAPKTVPTYGPGMFDWTIGGSLLFISDATNYKISAYSLKDNQQIAVLEKEFVPNPIYPEDSRLQSVGWDLPYVLKPGAMVNYPAIWKILATRDDTLLVFTGDRDISDRQIVHVYDRKFQLLGMDRKYLRPGLNNHFISGKLVYVADCSGDGRTVVANLSPLDTPALANKLRVFKLRLS
jgi:hypothetical protein